MKKIFYLIFVILLGCAAPQEKDEQGNPMYLGYVEKLPKGEYVIYNWGSRHIVRCERPDGKYYTLNDADFKLNNISGYDAHQYQNKTKIIIK